MLKEARVGRLSTVSANGLIHIIPICHVLHRGVIYVGTGASSIKVSNIKNNAEVAYLVDDYDEDWSKLKGVMVTGEATLIHSGEEFERIKTLLYKKFKQYESQAPMTEGESVVIGIRPARVLSWDYSE